MNIKNLKIGARLAGGFGLVLALIVLLIATGFLRLTHIGQDTDALVDEDWAKVTALSVIAVTTTNAGNLSMEMFIETDKSRIDELNRKILSYKPIVDEAIATLEKLLHTAGGKELLAKVKDQRSQYVDSFKQVTQLIMEDRREEAAKKMKEETLPALGALQESIQQFTELQNKITTQHGEEVKQNISSAKNMMQSFGLLALLIGAVCAFTISRSITGPLREAVRISQTVAAGDLTSHIDVNSTDETGQLLQALKNMNSSLVDIVGQVRSGADTIATASSQIAAGNLDLSARTEEQASSLEETASSMEELTGTVKQNADNARQANGLTLAASEIAVKGGAVMSEVVETMGSINDSAKKISDIIGVIDSIAFQTNILALNAAVEAARAGEQGRGFAVVATEVRNLAHRSAAAAKEIKGLIDDSVQKVEAGTKLVDRAGATMQEVVASVKRVTDIVAEMSTAGLEQASGIEQINQAVIQMDSVTQQNAALVEEGAAAAQSMQDQASNLVQVVGVFKLAVTSTSKPAIKSTQNAAALEIAPKAKTTQLPQKFAVRERRGNLVASSGQATQRVAAHHDWEEF